MHTVPSCLQAAQLTFPLYAYAPDFQRSLPPPPWHGNSSLWSASEDLFPSLPIKYHARAVISWNPLHIIFRTHQCPGYVHGATFTTACTIRVGSFPLPLHSSLSSSLLYFDFYNGYFLIHTTAYPFQILDATPNLSSNTDDVEFDFSKGSPTYLSTYQPTRAFEFFSLLMRYICT
ncbi:hypothetical protein BDZ97DRAFT_502127 [Flammula alnicola]|nr:hypothetical protein BDZ97DRAFT_502127 [Flammula alnicola]